MFDKLSSSNILPELTSNFLKHFYDGGPIFKRSSTLCQWPLIAFYYNGQKHLTGNGTEDEEVN